MCGIAGWIGFRDSIPPPLRLNLLAHRGPDDRGERSYLSASGRVAAALGSTRLAILDLSSAGRMPMEHEEEPLALVFNGEIYNFKELRQELAQAGERFASRTDTEVILRGYRVWGDRVVDRLRGMFAFALWDGRGDGRMLLARDRFGKKPLYYRVEEDHGLVFSSELKTLLHHNLPRDIDPESLEYYLDRGYPPPERCLLQGYRKILPGCLLIWERGRVREESYWNLFEVLRQGAAHKSRAEDAAALRERLKDAVKRRLVADVPVGLLLSGGVDSSSLLALMAGLTDSPVRSYTACFGATSLDESESARRTALAFGAKHHALLLNPRCGRLLPFVASQMDEPIADPSALATYLICRRARQEVTVLLAGDGSDELLLGYPRYRLHALAQVLTHALAPSLRKAICRGLPPWSILERVLSAPADPLLRDRYWLDHGRRRLGAFSSSPGHFSIDQALLRVLQEDITSWLVEDILIKVDKMSMAASVEVRAPFLDQEVASLILALPVKARLGLRQGKLVLFEAVRGMLPEHIFRSRKKPFHLPIDDWLRCEWRPLAQDVLLDPRTRERGWTDAPETRRLLDEHISGRAVHGRRLYQLLTLELWARAILDRGEAEPHPPSVADCVRELDPSRPLRRVAVIAPAGIGDTLRLTPGVRQLSRIDPNVSMTLYVAQGRETDQVMAGMSPVDRQVPLDFTRSGVGKIFPLLQDIRRNPPDVLVSTLISRLAWMVGACCGVRDRRAWVAQWSLALRLGGLFWGQPQAYNPPQRDVGRQDALDFCRLLGVPAPKSLQPYMAPPLWEESALAQARKLLQTLPRPLLAVNAVANASIPQRQYPLDKLAQALENLFQRGVISSAALFGDSHSRSRYGPLKAVMGRRALDLSGRLTLAATAASLTMCDAILTVDGGLLHVALATTLPVVAIYGPTEIYSTDPRDLSGRYKVLTAFDRCGCICLNHRGIRAADECRGEPRCLAALAPDQIVSAVAAALGKAGNVNLKSGEGP